MWHVWEAAAGCVQQRGVMHGSRRWPLPALPTSGITTALRPGLCAAAAAPLKSAMSDVVVVAVPAA